MGSSRKFRPCTLNRTPKIHSRKTSEIVLKTSPHEERAGREETQIIGGRGLKTNARTWKEKEGIISHWNGKEKNAWFSTLLGVFSRKI